MGFCGRLRESGMTRISRIRDLKIKLCEIRKVSHTLRNYIENYESRQASISYYYGRNRIQNKCYEGLISKEINMKYKATQIESMVLQVRMITELIALGSLAANKPLFEENLQKFKNLYHPKEILRDIEKLNPKFYPEPIVEIQAKDDSQKVDLFI